MSSGGWPSTLSDGTPGAHSFFSDDFILWEPWGDTGDFFIRAGQTWALANTTWSSVKAAFN